MSFYDRYENWIRLQAGKLIKFGAKRKKPKEK